jgi:hypothetical protein
MAAIPVDTRRVPRLTARCPTEVSFGAGRWIGLTEDLSAGGCRIVARLALHPGESVSLRLRYGGVATPLDVVGTVAWTAPRPPWKTGVAFARGQEDKARRFVRAVLSVAPELVTPQADSGFRAVPRPPPSSLQRPTPTLLPPRAARLRALLLTARTKARTGDREAALRDLRAAAELAPGHPEVLAEFNALGMEPEK